MKITQKELKRMLRRTPAKGWCQDRMPQFSLQNYSGLSFKHSMMMKMMFSYLKKKPAEELTGEDKAMMETYNQKISFVDYDSLKPIAEAIR